VTAPRGAAESPEIGHRDDVLKLAERTG
jgi:hypothetical protein